MTNHLPVLHRDATKTRLDQMSGVANVTAAIHPLRSERFLKTQQAGSTLQETVEAHCPYEYRNMVFVTVNGEFVSRRDWPTYIVRENDLVIIRAVPMGSTGRKILQTLLIIAAIAIVVFTGNIALALKVYMIGSALINALIPPSRGATANSDNTLPQYTFGIQGIQNQELPYGVMPRLFGRTLITPPKGAHSYTVTMSNSQYLYALFDLGPGPIAISDIKIGDTPIGSFSDVDYEVREGRVGDAPLTIYTNAVHQVSLSVGLLTAGANGTQRTPTHTTEISVDLTAPGGIFGVDNNGNFVLNTQTFDINIKQVPSGSDSTHTVTMQGNSTTANAGSFTYPIAEGEYDVKITRNTSPPDTKHGGAAVYWTAIRTQGVPPTTPMLPLTNAKIAVKIKATQQLNGDIQNLNCIAQAYVQVWNGTTFSEQLNTHPAWAAYAVMTGSSNARSLDPSRIDKGALLGWATTYPDAEFNYVFSSRTTVWQALRLIGSAGRATPVLRDGLYSFIYDHVQTNPVQLFTARNVHTFKATKLFQDEVHGMEIRYVSETMGWQQHSVFVFAAGLDANTADFTKVSVLDVAGVTSDDWAYKLGSYFFAASIDRATVYEFETDLDHLACNPGDRIAIQHDLIDAGIGSGRVTGITRNGSSQVTTVTMDEQITGTGAGTYSIMLRTRTGNIRTVSITSLGTSTTNVMTLTSAFTDAGDSWAVGDLITVATTTTAILDGVVKTITPSNDFKAQVTCLDYAPSIHAADGGASPPVVNDRIQQFFHSLPVSTITFIDLSANEDTSLIGTGHSYQPRIHGVFQPNMDGIPAQMYEVQYRTLTAVGWTEVLSLPSSAFEFYIPISTVSVGLKYHVRIRGTNYTRTNPGEWAEASLTITDYLIPPEPPASLTVTPIIAGVSAVIVPGTGRQPSKYRLYINTVNNSSTATVALESDSPIIKLTGLLSTTIYFFWATSITAGGAESDYSAVQSALPLPVGYDNLAGDVGNYLSFLADTVRNQSDQISQIAQGLSGVGLGNVVDLQTLTNGYINADSTLFSGLTSGYTNAINIATGPGSSISTAITALQATLVGYDSVTTVGSVVNAMQVVQTSDHGILTTAVSDISGVQAALTGYLGVSAVSSAFTSLNSSVSTINGSLTTLSSSITTVTSQVGNVYAAGLFRVTTAVTPSGADARIALQVAATSGGVAYGAAMYMDAMSTGVSRITMVADQFFITNGSTNSKPFFYSGTTLYLDSAAIQSLTANKIIGGTLDVGVINAGTINTNHLSGNAATDRSSQTTSGVSLVAYTFTAVASVTITQTDNYAPVIITAYGSGNLTFAELDDQGVSSGSMTAYLYRDGSAVTALSSGINTFTGTTGIVGVAGLMTSTSYNYIAFDYSCPVGVHTYTIYGYMKNVLVHHDAFGVPVYDYNGSVAGDAGATLTVVSFKR